MSNYSNMLYEIQGCMLFDDVINHVAIVNFFVSLVSINCKRLSITADTLGEIKRDQTKNSCLLFSILLFHSPSLYVVIANFP